MIWMKDNRRWLRWFGFIAVAGIAVQAVLGREVVRQLLHYWLPVIHACFAQIVFGRCWRCGVYEPLVGCRAPAACRYGSPSIHTVATVNAEVIFFRSCWGRDSGTEILFGRTSPGRFGYGYGVIWTAIVCASGLGRRRSFRGRGFCCT